MRSNEEVESGGEGKEKKKKDGFRSADFFFFFLKKRFLMNEAVSYLAVPLSLDIFAAERFGIAVEYCRIRLERKPLPLSLAVAHFDSLSLSSLLSLSLFNQFFFSFSF